MNGKELTRILDRANDSFVAARSASARVNHSLTRADNVMRQIAARDGPAREAARRERQRLNAGLKRRAAQIGVAVGLISIVTIVLGLLLPGGIGMFGFLAAVGLAVGVVGLLAFLPSQPAGVAAPPADLPNAEMVQRFDSYLYRSRPALPAPAQSQLDLISAALPGLRQTIERVDALDPSAQDARRLMSKHLPGLIDHYLNVPAAYRGERDGEGISVDERLVEGLAAARGAIDEISEKLARGDLNAFETQGRFIKSRYSDEPLEG